MGQRTLPIRRGSHDAALKSRSLNGNPKWVNPLGKTPCFEPQSHLCAFNYLEMRHMPTALIPEVLAGEAPVGFSVVISTAEQ